MTMFLTLLLTGLSTLSLPFSPNLPILLFCRFVQFLCYGIFLTGDSILLVFTLGPETSRPFINILHFFISIGFLIGTFLVQPFLPETSEEVCRSNSKLLDNSSFGNLSKLDSGLQGGQENQENSSLHIETILGIQSICWPFLISAGWCICISFGFVLLSYSNLQMPKFYGSNSSKSRTDFSSKSSDKLSRTGKRIFLVLVVLFFSLSGAVVRVFQSMTTTFALCGPLALDSHSAALTDSFFSSGMCLGRMFSVLLSTIFLPSTLLCSSTLFCGVASLLLLLLAPHFTEGLYSGVLIMGFFVSWQFGTGFSWTSQYMNITGKLSSLFFVGLGVGSIISPPLAGYIFTINSMWVLYLAAVLVLIQVVTVALLHLVSKKGSSAQKEER
ncbi:sodium-dependent glucose transporter 1 isoform X2 [Eurytemora carolleeae]|nr:sodium-dependent glucose transporter 1 isoform X2 [Eurytemora carolleeae]|eukprot:XP_023332189.1 sodium-dependent glucose transporter 1-like isoform X2 [Eurytemora affinis]